MPEAPLEAQSKVGALKPYMTSREREQERELARVRGVCQRPTEKRVEQKGKKKKKTEGNKKK